jgi:hypothetical protein
VRMPERLDFAIVLPKLHVLTINELLGVFLGGVIVWANQFDCPEELTVDPNNVRSISGHLRHRPNPYAIMKMPFGPSATKLKFKKGQSQRTGTCYSKSLPPLMMRSISYLTCLMATARLTGVTPDLLLPSSNLISHRQPAPSVN